MWSVQITVPFLKLAKQGEILSATDLRDIVDNFSFHIPSPEDEDQRMIIYAQYRAYWGPFGRVVEQEDSELE